MKEKRVPQFLNHKYPLLIFFATLIMGVGYASTNVVLNINASATVLEENTIHITNAIISGTPTSGSGSVTSYEGTLLNTTTTLNNSSGSVTYAVTIKNNTNSTATFYGLCKDNSFYTNQYVTYSYTGLSDNDTIASGASATAYVTFTDDGASSFPSVLTSALNFNFTEACSGAQVIHNPDGSTTTIVQNPDGSTTSTTVYPDNSSVSTTTQPDNSYVTTTIDADDNVSVQTVNSSGEVTSYTITTPADSNMIISNNQTVDTGVIAFNGQVFTIEARIKVNLGNSSNNNKFILSALEQTQTSPAAYSGFSLWDYNSQYMRLSTYKNGQRSAQTGILTSNKNVTAATERNEAIFSITLTYNPQGHTQGNKKYAKLSVSVLDELTNQTTNTYINNTKNSQLIPEQLDNAIITIGGNGLDNNDNINNMEILAFSVTKS